MALLLALRFKETLRACNKVRVEFAGAFIAMHCWGKRRNKG